MAVRNRDYKVEYAKRKARRIIRERELKRGKPLNPTYRKRLESGLLKGKTVQQARGHKRQEHIQRKLKSGQGPGIADKRERFIFQWFAMRDFEIADWTGDPVDQTRIAVSRGWDWFKNYSKTWEALREQYLREMREGSYASKGMGFLDYLLASTGAPEYSWLYYH